jgi:cytochrome c peroxidase
MSASFRAAPSQACRRERRDREVGCGARRTRGEIVFNGVGGCYECHVPPLDTEPGWNMHDPSEIGIDDFQASRSPDGKMRTSPLRAMFIRNRGGFFHDGRFPTLMDVVEHYDSFFQLGLTAQQKSDLVEFLKSI